MPNYTYTDGVEIKNVTHAVDWEGEVVSSSGLRMWRMPPKRVGINWGGLKPSDMEGMSPEIQKLTDPKTIDARRGEYERKKND